MTAQSARRVHRSTSSGPRRDRRYDDDSGGDDGGKDDDDEGVTEGVTDASTTISRNSGAAAMTRSAEITASLSPRESYRQFGEGWHGTEITILSPLFFFSECSAGQWGG